MIRSRTVLAALGVALALAAVAPPLDASRAASSRPRPQTDAQPPLWIGPVYFNWFGVNRRGQPAGQYYSPWLPIEGRLAWDGSVKYHKLQLKRIVKAKFNMIFSVDTFGYKESQGNLFTAIKQRSKRGWKTPAVAPYFAAGTFECRECPKNFSQRRDRTAFYNEVREWFEQFFSELGRKHLVWMDDKVLIGVWWVPGNDTAEPGFFRDMNNRLKRDFGFEAHWSVNFTWEGEADEINNTFATLDPYYRNAQGNVDLLVGFWPPVNQDRNNFLAREGGKTYIDAWDKLIASVADAGCADSAVIPRRITVVSYNEFTEGSGIYPAECMHHNPSDRHWSGPPSLERCTDKACHPFRKRDFWATNCNAKRAPFLYLDISKRKINKLERELRRGSACGPSGG